MGTVAAAEECSRDLWRRSCGWAAALAGRRRPRVRCFL